VRDVVARLHGKNVVHGDLNPWNVVVADDGRTVLLDPVPFAKTELALQDELCLDEMGRQVEACGGS
jgi:RIO-like serine/threonine protein kinase